MPVDRLYCSTDLDVYFQQTQDWLFALFSFSCLTSLGKEGEHHVEMVDELKSHWTLSIEATVRALADCPQLSSICLSLEVSEREGAGLLVRTVLDILASIRTYNELHEQWSPG